MRFPIAQRDVAERYSCHSCSVNRRLPAQTQRKDIAHHKAPPTPYFVSREFVTATLAIYIQVDREEESSVWQEVCMPVSGAKERIDSALQGWSGVTAQPHRFGGTEYRLGRREIGHFHGDRLVDIPFPKKIRDELVAAGRAEPHHILPESGWVSIYLREVPDVERAIELLRLSFEIANERTAK